MVEEALFFNKYFGKHLKTLLQAQQDNEGFKGYFVQYVDDPSRLEARLQRIEPLGLTSKIMLEIGDEDPNELDSRLVDAWAEIRTADQLFREGFYNIVKVEKTADFTAQCGEHTYAFQVARINKILGQLNRDNKYKTDPYGSLADIHDEERGLVAQDGPINTFFCDVLVTKNGEFRKWNNPNDKRCIVIVSIEEDLQDSMTRHIACQKIRAAIHDDGLGTRYFHELLWLPDTGNGAWFLADAERSKTRCFADWSDQVPAPKAETVVGINRREVDLDSYIPPWKIDSWKPCPGAVCIEG